ncbi:hypothetical protein [Anaeromyxobacter paludicola]|uniref:Uncharacterized protein n=1 Tax=Anaeromyxobacter paludicola TaxID=2918171 RepID=A0ABM7X710_9BACT|nr:hypothetical protein [Anaeromyxobacter paludicola]BDG07619.1 hypothetical protein AMPC_07320 [Anaeromyxobacter paludicola]
MNDAKKYPVMLTHQVPLRAESSSHMAVDSSLTVPRDLTPEEAERIGGVLKAFAVAWSDHPEPTP